MQKILMKVAWFGGGVREFEENVNEQLDKGWTVRHVNVTKGGIGLRMVCMAVLEHSDSLEHTFDQTTSRASNPVFERGH